MADEPEVRSPRRRRSRRRTTKYVSNARPTGWRATPLPPSAAAAVRGQGRITVDDFNGRFNFAVSGIVPPPTPDAEWYNFRLDDRAFRYLPPWRLLEIISDISPDFSNALWMFLRLCNPGWTVKAFRPGTRDVESRAQQVIDAFLDRLDDMYGSVDVLWGRLFSGAGMRGAFFAELVLAENGRDAIDLALPDPATVRFRRDYDEQRGVVFTMGQYQGRDFTVISGFPTVRYTPIDPHTGNPYGRAIFAPGVFSSVFLLGVLHDMRRVIANQGWDRNDVSIVLENLKASMPDDEKNDPEAWLEWVQGAIDQTTTTLEQLGPSDTFVHTDTIQMNRPVGTNSIGGLAQVGGIIERLERQLGRSLKMMPLLMGLADGTSEANANRQWEIQAAGIKSIQHYAETLIERLLQVACRAQGIQATIEFRFAELRAAELMRDMQVQRMRWENLAFAEAQGWIDDVEAANEAVGHDPTGEKEQAQPAPQPVPNPDDGGGTNPDPGSDRAPRTRSVPHECLVVEGACLFCSSRAIQPAGAGTSLPAIPSDTTPTPGQVTMAMAEWDRTMPTRVGLLDAEVVDG